MNKKLKTLFLIVLSMITIFLFKNNTYAATVANLSDTGVSWGGTTVGYFKIDGIQAFCVDHNKAAPNYGTYYGGEIYNDARVRKILYYGWGGAGQWSGFNGNYKKGTIITTMELNKYFHGDNRSYLAEFENFLDSQPDPIFTTDFSNKNLVAHIEGDKQITEQTLIEGSDNVKLTFKLQDGVTLVCDNYGWTGTGNVTVSAGDIIHFEAPLSINGSWTSDEIINQATLQPLLFISTNPNYQRLARRGDIVVDPNGTTNISIQWINLGNLEIHKIDSLTKTGIKNTTFKVTGNGLDTTITTDENGYAKLEKIVPGIYKITEINSNLSYYIDTNVKEVKVNENSTEKIEIENRHTEGELEILKVDKNNNEIKIKGVKFELYSEEFSKVVASGITDENGEVKFSNLRTGNYKVYEVASNEWYKLNNEKYSVTIKKDETTYKTIENEPKMGRVKVVKVDKDNNKTLLKGVKFDVIDDKGNVLETITTDENGQAITKEYAIKDYKNLILKETEALKEYKLSNDELKVTLKADEIITKTIENEMKKAQIKVIKVDKENKEIKIPDVVFEVYNSNKELVDTITTDKNGIAITKKLPVNDTYSLKEIKSNKFYKLDDDIVKIDLTKYIENYKADIIESTIIENQVKKGTIKIIKIDGDTKYPLKDIVFEIYNEKGDLLETIITDENGEATSSKYPIYQKYTVVEKETKKGYELNEKVEIVELKENEITNLTFENFKEKGKIKIVKTSSDGKVEGFSFKITGISVTGENIEMIVMTDKDGIILVEDVLVGEYTIEEIRDENYEETEPQTVIVTNGEIAEVSFYNKLIEIEVPQTSDDRNITLWSILLTISIIGIIILLVCKYIKDRKNKQ